MSQYYEVIYERVDGALAVKQVSANSRPHAREVFFEWDYLRFSPCRRVVKIELAQYPCN